VGNAVKGLKACGIEPFNPNVFSDFDFLSAAVTETPFIQEKLPNTELTLELISQNEGNTPILSHSNECNTPTSNQTNKDNIPTSCQTNEENILELSRINEENIHESSQTNKENIPTSSQINEIHLSPSKISSKLPALTVAVRSISKRRPMAKMPSLEITSSPVKSILETKI